MIWKKDFSHLFILTPYFKGVHYIFFNFYGKNGNPLEKREFWIEY